jgi:hypothetical protein
MQPERLRIVHTESSTGWGGQEIRILTEAEGMLGRGHQVTLLTPPAATIYQAAQRRGIPVVAMAIEKKRPSALAAMIRFLFRERERCDVINTHSSTDSWLTALAAILLRGAPPVVRTRHVSTAVSRDRATRWLYTRASAHVVTTGEALDKNLAGVRNAARGRRTGRGRIKCCTDPRRRRKTLCHCAAALGRAGLAARGRDGGAGRRRASIRR